MKDSSLYDQYFWLENGEQRCDVPGFFRARAMQPEIESRRLQIEREYRLWLRTKRKEKENMNLLGIMQSPWACFKQWRRDRRHRKAMERVYAEANRYR